MDSTFPRGYSRPLLKIPDLAPVTSVNIDLLYWEHSYQKEFPQCLALNFKTSLSLILPGSWRRGKNCLLFSSLSPHFSLELAFSPQAQCFSPLRLPTKNNEWINKPRNLPLTLFFLSPFRWHEHFHLLNSSNSCLYLYDVEVMDSGLSISISTSLQNQGPGWTDEIKCLKAWK